MNKVQVVAAIIVNNRRFLLGKRAPHKTAPGWWSPVSGRIELGETESEAAERECQEEVGLTVRAVRKITEMDINEGKARLHWWLVDVVSGEAWLKNDEHTELRWMTIEEMGRTENVFTEDIPVFASVLPKED